ncbi:MAG: hypothetical protein U1G08_21330 [Verrucomicrobiota bacterium]
MTKQQRAVLGLVIAGTALVFVALWKRAASHVTEPVSLPDGTHLHIRSVVVGRRLYSPYDSLVSRFVAKLPGPLRTTVSRVIAPATPVWSGPSQAWGLWLESDAVPTAFRTNRAGLGSAYLVVLNDGRPFRVSAATSTSTSLPDGRFVEGHVFPVPPTSISKISVAVYPRPASGVDDPDPGPPLIRWWIHPGPIPTAAPWVGTPLPQRRTSEDLEVVLTNLVVNVASLDGSGSKDFATNAVDAWVSAGFELFQRGQPAPQWQVERVNSLEDPLGSNFGGSQTWQNGSNYVRWRPALWPGQPWKLAVEFTRVSGFATNELVTFTNLSPGVLDTTPRSTTNGSVTLKQVGDTRWGQASPELVLSFQPVRLPARLTLVSVVDARGNPVQGSRSSWSDSETTFRLERTSYTNGPFTATFALQLGRVLEFLAEPQVGVTSPAGIPSPKGR